MFGRRASRGHAVFDFAEDSATGSAEDSKSVYNLPRAETPGFGRAAVQLIGVRMGEIDRCTSPLSTIARALLKHRNAPTAIVCFGAKVAASRAKGSKKPGATIDRKWAAPLEELMSKRSA